MELKNVLASRNHKTIYRDGNLAIKVFDNEFSKADILHEAMNQARVEDCGLNIPRVREVCKIDGKWAIATEFIEGDTLMDLMERNPEKMEEYLEKFVELQLQVQSTKVSKLTSLVDKMNKKISETEFSATTRYELHTRLESFERDTKLCHGDFNPSNVIVTPQGEYYILDWGHVTYGSAEADVARTYLVCVLVGRDDVAEKYLNIYCKKADIAKQQVQKWLPIVAASQSVKGRPEQKELLSKWVDVVDFD